MATRAIRAAREVGTTFPNVQIQPGANAFGPMAVTVDTRSIYVIMSRDNWPPEGCTLEGQLSFNGGSSWQTVAGPLFVPPHTPDPKEPTPTPADIGYSWGEGMPQPTHARLVVNNHGARFRSDLRIDVG